MLYELYVKKQLYKIKPRFEVGFWKKKKESADLHFSLSQQFRIETINIKYCTLF